MRYDRDGDQHYDVISAFIKSMRGSDVDAALHYLARMIEAGEDPRFIARRLVVLASEDVGLADPTALLAASAAAQAVQLIGMPEARLNLAQATHPPRARAEVERGGHGDRRGAGRRAGRARPVPVPPHLRDGHYPGAARLRARRAATATRTTVPEGVVEPAVPARRTRRPRLLRAVRSAGRKRQLAAEIEPVLRQAARRPVRAVADAVRVVAGHRRSDAEGAVHRTAVHRRCRPRSAALRWRSRSSRPAHSCCSSCCSPIPLLKLGRTLDEATLAIRKTHEGAAPLLADAQDTLVQVNPQLEQVEGIAKNVNSDHHERGGADVGGVAAPSAAR